MSKLLKLNLGAGFCFTAWPLLMRATGLNWIWAGFILNLVSMLVFLPLVFGKSTPSFTSLPVVAVVGVMLAGCINGVGHVFFQQTITLKEEEISVAIMALIMIQILANAAAGRMFYSEPITFQKAVGIVMAIGAVILLTKK